MSLFPPIKKSIDVADEESSSKKPIGKNRIEENEKQSKESKEIKAGKKVSSVLDKWNKLKKDLSDSEKKEDIKSTEELKKIYVEMQSQIEDWLNSQQKNLGISLEFFEKDADQIFSSLSNKFAETFTTISINVLKLGIKAYQDKYRTINIVFKHMRDNYFTDRKKLLKSKKLDVPADVVKNVNDKCTNISATSITSALTEYRDISLCVAEVLSDFDAEKKNNFFSEINKEVLVELVELCKKKNDKVNDAVWTKHFLDYREFESSYKVIWDYFDENREKLKIVLDAGKYNQNVSLTNQVPYSQKAVNKALSFSTSYSEKSNALPESLRRFNILLNYLRTDVFPSLKPEIIKAIIKEIQENPPPPLPCPLISIFLRKNIQDLFENANTICYLLDFFTIDELILFRSLCNVTYNIVDMHLRRKLYFLPYHKCHSITNLDYWYSAIKFFTKDGCFLNPLDRFNDSKYFFLNPLVQLRENRAFLFPISHDQMKSVLSVSLDNLPEGYIRDCDFLYPMRHTCSSKKRITGPSKGMFKCLSIGEFIREYYKRASVVKEEIIWSQSVQFMDKKFVSLLFFQFLKCIEKIMIRHKGLMTIKKTEYLVNTGFHITHRIWLQVTCKWGPNIINDNSSTPVSSKEMALSKDGKKSMLLKHKVNTSSVSSSDSRSEINDTHAPARTLYLTIADHFAWDG